MKRTVLKRAFALLIALLFLALTGAPAFAGALPTALVFIKHGWETEDHVYTADFFGVGGLVSDPAPHTGRGSLEGEAYDMVGFTPVSEEALSVLKAALGACPAVERVVFETPASSPEPTLPVVKATWRGKISEDPFSFDGKAHAGACLELTVENFGLLQEVAFTVTYDPDVLKYEFAGPVTPMEQSYWDTQDVSVPGRVVCRVFRSDDEKDVGKDLGSVSLPTLNFSVVGEGDPAFALTGGTYLDADGGAGQVRTLLLVNERPFTPRVKVNVRTLENGTAQATVRIADFDRSQLVDFALFYDPEVLEPVLWSDGMDVDFSVESASPGVLTVSVHNTEDVDLGHLLLTQVQFRIKKEGDFCFALSPGLWIDENGKLGFALGTTFENGEAREVADERLIRTILPQFDLTLSEVRSFYTAVLADPELQASDFSDSEALSELDFLIRFRHVLSPEIIVRVLQWYPAAPQIRAVFALLDPQTAAGGSLWQASALGVGGLTAQTGARAVHYRRGGETFDLVRFTPKTQADAGALKEALSSNESVKGVIVECSLGRMLFRLGDADGPMFADHEITAADARQALRYAVGLDLPDPVCLAAADADLDGEVTAADARLILRASVDLEKL